MNSVDQQPDGATLISARNTWALYELSTRTGRSCMTIWRQALERQARHGAATAFQHDATVLPNGDDQRVRQRRRALRAPAVARRDREHQRESGHRAGDRPVRAPRRATDLGQPGQRADARRTATSSSAGARSPTSPSSAPRVSCCSTPTCTATIRPIAPTASPGPARPARPPSIALSGSGAHRSVYASWNGDTRTATWRVFAGSSAKSLAPVTSAARSGFETAIALPVQRALRGRAGARLLGRRARHLAHARTPERGGPAGHARLHFGPRRTRR